MQLTEILRGAHVIRAARRDDLGGIEALAKEFAGYQRGLGEAAPRRLDSAALKEHGFAHGAPLQGVVAEIDGRVAGYLLYRTACDASGAARRLVAVDLFVTAAARGRGIGAELLNRARKMGTAAQSQQLTWNPGLAPEGDCRPASTVAQQ